MDNEASSLFVGSLPVCSREEIDDELLTVFREDMAHVERVPAERYEGYAATDEPFADALIFRAPGHVISDRLDAMGIDAMQVLADLDEELRYQASPLDDELVDRCDEETRALIRMEHELLARMNAQDWVGMLAQTPDDPGTAHDTSPGSRWWLLHYLDPDNGWHARRRLRAILLAFPAAEVTLDATWVGDWHTADPARLLSRAQRTVEDNAATHAPLVVVTEGKTDAEFLRAALTLLYPHLTDLVRFLDYERKPEGGAVPALLTVRALDAAGIANRVVAVLDNDTAAADALRTHGRNGLSDRIRVIQYPPLGLAQQYPSLGPPAVHSPSGSIELADVNGLAASIELYLGKDVLTGEDGHLRPVQWTSFIPGMNSYHGVVTGKHDIHEAFRAKVAAASPSRATASWQDWEGLRLILKAILTAFLQPHPPEKSAASAEQVTQLTL